MRYCKKFNILPATPICLACKHCLPPSKRIGGRMCKNEVTHQSKAVSELNALCDVLSFMRTPTAFPSAKQMYKHFCKPGTGTICVRYVKSVGGRIFLVQFEYITWLGAVSRLQIDTTKYY